MICSPTPSMRTGTKTPRTTLPRLRPTASSRPPRSPHPLSTKRRLLLPFLPRHPLRPLPPPSATRPPNRALLPPTLHQPRLPILAQALSSLARAQSPLLRRPALLLNRRGTPRTPEWGSPSLPASHCSSAQPDYSGSSSHNETTFIDVHHRPFLVFHNHGHCFHNTLRPFVSPHNRPSSIVLALFISIILYRL
jgi:hypothetical protein